MTAPLTQTGEYEFTRGDRLRKAREHRGLNQDEFAREAGISRATVSNAEGDKPVQNSTIKLWAIATGFDEQWLRTGHKSRSKHMRQYAYSAGAA